jgi:hypothetical protein
MGPKAIADEIEANYKTNLYGQNAAGKVKKKGETP